MIDETASFIVRTRRRRAVQLMMVVLGLPLLSLAQTPLDSAAAPGGGDLTVEKQEPPPPPRPFGPPGFGGRRGMNGESWEKAQAFMELHSPFRLRILQSLDDESPRKWRMKNLILSQYAALNESNENSEIYKLRVERIERDDASFQIAVSLRVEQERQPNDPSKIEELRRKLNQQTQRLVELGLEERRLRIKRLEAAVVNQKAILAKDEANQKKLAQWRAESLVRRADLFRNQSDSYDAFMEEMAASTTQPSPK